MAPQWAAFVGLTGLVIAVFLALARLSQAHVSSADAESLAPDTGRLAVPDAPSGLDPGVTTTTPEVSLPASALRDRELSTGALLANVALTQGLFGIVLLGGAVVFAIPASAFGAEALFADLTGPPMLVGLGLGVVLWLASEAGGLVVDAAGIDHDEALRSMLAPDSLGGWLLLLGVVLPVIAGVEELVFRAAAIGVLSMGFGISPWTLAVFTSFLFGLGHGAQGTAGIVVTGVLGLVLAFGFVITGSFVTVFVAHYLVNALEFLVHEGLGVEF